MNAVDAPRITLDSLNPAQRQAVVHGDGPLLVLAGAGSGKTRVLTTRIARLVEERGVEPGQILAVTFTNKAAGEMRNRVGHALGRDPAGMWIGTFHAIGARMLRRAPQLAGRGAAFTIYDADDTLTLVKRAMDRARVSNKQFAPRAVQGAISQAKNALVDLVEYERLAADPFTRAVAAVYRESEAALAQANAADFDDLLVLPVRMLAGFPDELRRYQERFRHILVDEYQDTNSAQYELVRMLAGTDGNVCVVGDDDQSIYGWRGANIRNILDFGKDFPSAAVVRLEENYRSTAQILELANAVISHNTGRMGKTLRATQGNGDRVIVLRALDERDEAEWVVDQIVGRAATSRDPLRDTAILYRTNAQSRALEEALRRHALPYRLIGAVRFYDRREIRDLMSYLKLIANPADDEAFRRAVAVPRRGVGDTSLEQLAALARDRGMPMLAAAGATDVQQELRSGARGALAEFAATIAALQLVAAEAGVDELLRELIEAIRYADHLRAEGPEGDDRLENVRELIAGAAEVVADDLGEVGLRPLDHFLQRAALVADIDGLDPNADAITLMTLHNAKGLEFPTVFITGLEDGLFPLARAFDDPPLLEEERRLFYVGITRAEQRLVISHAEERRRNGELLPGRRSSFLDTVPDGMVEQRQTIKVRSSGRGFMRGAYGLGGPRGTFGSADLGGDRPSVPASVRRPGRPFAFVPEEDVSQDAPTYAVGARVKHRKFGSGTIAELSGNGRDAKVKIDFDDEEIGRKTLVLAQAALERGDE